MTHSSECTRWRVHALTWQGHEFVEGSRNETMWIKAKSTINEKGIGMAFDTMKAMLIALGKQAIDI